jgi:hypothetical protein
VSASESETESKSNSLEGWVTINFSLRGSDGGGWISAGKTPAVKDRSGKTDRGGVNGADKNSIQEF